MATYHPGGTYVFDHFGSGADEVRKDWQQVHGLQPGFTVVTPQGVMQITGGTVGQYTYQPLDIDPSSLEYGVRPVVTDQGVQAQGGGAAGYLQELYAAKEAADLAALEGAYQKNVMALDAVRSQVGPLYQAARNQTAATKELQSRNFAEYAAASGLGTGTAGQAALARSVAYQGAMGEISAQEASAYAALDLERGQLAVEYNTAITQAKQTGAYQLANALYQEAVRLEEQMMRQAAEKANQDLKTFQLKYAMHQDDLSARQWQQNFDFQQSRDEVGKTQQSFENQLRLAQLMAQYGDFSGYAALGLDTSQMAAEWARRTLK